MKELLRKLRNDARLSWNLLRDSLYDATRIIRYSHSSTRPISQTQSQYRIRKAYHGIEKGMSLAAPRYQFGLAKLDNLVLMLNEHIRRYGLDSTAIAASSAVAAYDRANDTNFVKLIHGEHQSRESSAGGVEIVHPPAFDDPMTFLKSRRSIRQFTEEPVSRETIEKAVSVAQTAPSVCNRQTGKVYAFDDARILSLQPGNSGFGHTAAWGLVVTSDLKGFSGSGERHQAWCDGGMFAMALLYGLHAFQLGACPLAWTASPRRDKAVRRMLSIPDNEVIIMFVAVGAVAPSFGVAKSFRKDMKDALIFGQAPSIRELGA